MKYYKSFLVQANIVNDNFTTESEYFLKLFLESGYKILGGFCNCL